MCYIFQRKDFIDDETMFCDADLLANLLKHKVRIGNIFWESPEGGIFL